MSQGGFNLNQAQTFYLRLKTFVAQYPEFKPLVSWCLSQPEFATGEMEHQDFYAYFHPFVLEAFGPAQEKMAYLQLGFVVGSITTPEDDDFPLFERTKTQISLRFYRLLKDLTQRYQPQALKVTLELARPLIQRPQGKTPPA